MSNLHGYNGFKNLVTYKSARLWLICSTTGHGGTATALCATFSTEHDNPILL